MYVGLEKGGVLLALLSFLVLAVLVAALAAVHVPGVCLGLKKAGALLALRLYLFIVVPAAW
jgi:hypothetical protein